VDLIRAVVLVTDVQLLKFSSDVIGCSSVGVPGRIYRCTISSSNQSFVGDEVFVEAMPTFSCGVIWLEAHLAERLVVRGVVKVALIIVAAVAATVVATTMPTVADLAWRLILPKAAVTSCWPPSTSMRGRAPVA
jgi:hypothetical protein